MLVHDPGAEGRRSVARGELLTGREFQDRVVSLLMTPSPELSELLRLIVIRHTIYSLALNPSMTEDDREQGPAGGARDKGNVVQQEAIVRANEPITPEIWSDSMPMRRSCGNVNSSRIRVSGSG